MAVVATLSKGYDLDYIWKQVDRGPAKDAASYYIQASESGGEPPGRWWGPGAKALGFEPGQTVERKPYALLFGERSAPDGTQLGRPPSGGRKAADLYATLLTAEPHATAERKRELRAEAVRKARQSPLFFDLTISLSKSISLFHASLGENARLARQAGDKDGDAYWSALLVVGGWMSLLAATTLIDLHRDQAAAAHLRTAAQLAREAGHAEITAWCLETQAWQVLTAGDYQRAADISQAAQRIAPKAGSAFIQATAQEGRAWARLGAAAQTRAALSRVEALVSPLPMPARPEHHYRYDPPKAQVYVATTLSWLGDKAAERLTRQVLAAIEAPGERPRPRRAGLARLDLALALTAAGKHDEAAGMTLEAIKSGRLAPVDGRRAREIVLAVAGRGVPEAAELAEAYQAACGDSGSPPALP